MTALLNIVLCISIIAADTDRPRLKSWGSLYEKWPKKCNSLPWTVSNKIVTSLHYPSYSSLNNRSWFSALRTTRTTRHYTVKLNSVIVELATASSLEQERFQGMLQNW